ncbi:MAG TPA: PIN domain-containing protein [Gemmatimonadaceae bacterium]|nr:PIN domain-containing protein [Gemmatimonadaceae bacterium]
MTVVADTGAIFALIDASDAWHERVTAWWRANTQSVVLPVSILPEVAHLLQTRISSLAELAFVRAVADGEFTVEPLEPEDVTRADALMRRYLDLPLGFADATVIATAERLDAREIVTTDRRHFRVAGASGSRTIRLLP